jgi:hypothetical protein
MLTEAALKGVAILATRPTSVVVYSLGNLLACVSIDKYGASRVGTVV